MLPLETAPYFKATENELAYSNAQVIWHEQRGDYAVVLAMLPNMLFTTDREEKLKLCLAVLDYADLATDEPGLAVLGAGPMEDLMSDWLLDRLETRIGQDARLRYALSMVRIEVEPEPLQERLAELLK